MQRVANCSDRYNSVILTSRSSNEYNVLVGPSDYDGSRQLNVSNEMAACFPDYLGESYSQFSDQIRTGNFEILDKLKCLDRLAVNFPSGQGTVMILSNNLTLEDKFPLASIGLGNSLQEVSVEWPSYQWMCPLSTPNGCPTTEIRKHIDEWTVYAIPWIASQWRITVPASNNQTLTYRKSNYTGCPDWGSMEYCDDLGRVAYWGFDYEGISAQKLNSTLHSSIGWYDPSWAAEVRFEQANTTCHSTFGSPEIGIIGDSYTVDGCLSMSVDQRCQLLFVPSFAMIVIGCGVIKLACIAFIAHRDSGKKLLTVGDAIASFLTRPDPYTTKRCLKAKSDWDTGPSFWEKEQHIPIPTRPRKLAKKRKWWWQAASPVLWALTLFL